MASTKKIFEHNKQKQMEILTRKEEEVMEFIWDYGPCSPKDVVELYDNPKPHVNTIATMFQNLEKKAHPDIVYEMIFHTSGHLTGSWVEKEEILDRYE